MNKKIIAIGAGMLGLLGIVIIAKKASAGQCYVVDNIGTGPSAPYHYATYQGDTLTILDAFGDTNYDIFTVEFLIEGVYQQVFINDIIPHGQKFRFQVVRTTEICHIKMEIPTA